MAEPDTLHDAFIDGLRDTYNAEKQLEGVRPRRRAAARTNPLRAAAKSADRCRPQAGMAQKL